MANENEFIRFASANEQRTITRENLGHYNSVIISAVYDLGPGFDPSSPELFYHPLQRCIEQHPWLCAVVGDAHTDKSFYQRVPTMDLRRHISIAEGTTGLDDLTQIQEVLESNLNKSFAAGIPPWWIAVLPLTNHCFIALCFSHTVADGMTGVAFHHTFLEARRDRPEDTTQPPQIITTPTKPLPLPFDTPENLPISWSFLLGPLMTLAVPPFIAKYLGIRVTTAPVDQGTWTGTKIFFDPKTNHHRLRLREIDAHSLTHALRASKEHNATLTGTFQEIVVRALSRSIPDPSVTNFVSQIVINARPLMGFPSNTDGQFGLGRQLCCPRVPPSDNMSDENWAAAAATTRAVREAASTLQDQIAGLMRYLPSMRRWMLNKIGTKRDVSFEVSNVGVFDSQGSGDRVPRITKMIFGQPGHVTGVLVSFNLASVRGGSLVFTVSWQAGCLGIEGDEAEFIEKVCDLVKQDLLDL